MTAWPSPSDAGAAMRRPGVGHQEVKAGTPSPGTSTTHLEADERLKALEAPKPATGCGGDVEWCVPWASS